MIVNIDNIGTSQLFKTKQSRCSDRWLGLPTTVPFDRVTVPAHPGVKERSTIASVLYRKSVAVALARLIRWRSPQPEKNVSESLVPPSMTNAQRSVSIPFLSLATPQNAGLTSPSVEIW